MAAVACGAYVKVLSLDNIKSKDIKELYSLHLRIPGNYTITDVSWSPSSLLDNNTTITINNNSND
jgi:hypothetical protein